MTKNEKNILKSVVDRGGLLSPPDLINGIAQRDRKSVENLIVQGYIEEVPQDIHRMHGNSYKVTFYRPTNKGLLLFAPWHTRIWEEVRKDIRTIIFSTITALITTLIAIFLEKFLTA